MGSSRSLASLLLLPSFILASGGAFRGASNPFPSKKEGVCLFPVAFFCPLGGIHPIVSLLVFTNLLLFLFFETGS